MTSRFGKQWRAGLLLACASLFTQCVETEPQAQEHRQSNGALAGCTPVAGNITVCGTAVDGSGVPLAGAKVQLAGLSTVTASDGTFSLSAATAPRVTFTLSANGYMPYSADLTRDQLNRTITLSSLYTQVFPQPMPVTVVDPTTGAGTQLDLNLLMDSAGHPAMPPITVGVRYLDPSRVSMPGDDGALDSAGVRTPLESFGVTYVEARDGAGQLLQLRPGAQAQVFVPITNLRLPAAPPTIQLWSQPPGSGTWTQQPTPAQQQPNTGKRQCLNGAAPASCNPDDCTTLSPKNYVGSTNTLGFINCDIEKQNPACLRINVNASLLSPSDVPVCLTIKIPVAGGSEQTRQVCAGDGSTVLYNIPANVNLTISRGTLNCPTPPTTSVTVNSGAPWGGEGPPSSPGLCNSVLNIPPLP